MAIQRTFSIIKPDAVEKNSIGGIVQMIAHGFLLNLVGIALVTLVTFWLLVPTLGIGAK